MNIRRGSKYKLWGYVGYITIDPRFEDVKIVVFKKASSQEEAEWNDFLTNGIPMEYKGNEKESILSTWHIIS